MPVRTSQPAIAYLAQPPTGQDRGVLVIHAWWGLNAFCKEVCDRLAQAGFVAAAPDLYEGQVASAISEARSLRDRPRREPSYKTLTRAVSELTAHPAIHGNAIGVVGFSMGGHWALWLAQQPDLPIAAVVTFYGARSGDYSNSRAAFMGHFAEKDDYVSDASLKKLRKSLDAVDRRAELFTYPGATHWFFEQDRPDAYQPAAAALAWERTLSFLHEQLPS